MASFAILAGWLLTRYVVHAIQVQHNSGRDLEGLQIHVPRNPFGPADFGSLNIMAETFGTFNASNDYTADVAKCRLSETNTCPILDMESPATLIYPGGRTSCLNGEYAFLVRPGDKDKVLLWFGGGGACWEQMSYDMGACSRDLNICMYSAGINSTGDGIGIFNRAKDLNPFRSHTIVEAFYCTGDAFVGNITRNSWLYEGKPTVQVGYQNAMAAVTWTLENFDYTLDSLVVAGESGGSLGVHAWSNYILHAFKYKQAAVIADSFAGIWPPGVSGPQIKEFSACAFDDLWPPEIIKLCSEDLVTVQDMFPLTMRNFPHVKFGQIQSKVDSIQSSFYKVVALTNGILGETFISEKEFFHKANEIFETYNKEPNYVLYNADGRKHGYLVRRSFYTSGVASAELLLHQWISKLVAADSVGPPTVCSGQSLPSDVSNGITYCDDQLVPKLCQT